MRCKGLSLGLFSCSFIHVLSPPLSQNGVIKWHLLRGCPSFLCCVLPAWVPTVALCLKFLPCQISALATEPAVVQRVHIVCQHKISEGRDVMFHTGPMCVCLY